MNPDFDSNPDPNPNPNLNSNPNSDLDELLAFETACFAEPWNAKMLAEVLGDEKYLVRLHRDASGKAIGYLIGWEIAGEAELARIGVVPATRGQGWARQILDEALQIWRNRGVTRVFLEVRASNHIARRLYQSRGFETVGKRAHYYEDGEDAVVLSLSLDA